MDNLFPLVCLSFQNVFEYILRLDSGYCTASVASFCIAADKHILECARKNSLLEEALRQQS